MKKLSIGAGLLAVSLFVSGCGGTAGTSSGGTAPSAQSSTETSILNEVGTLPIAKEKQPLSITMPQNVLVEDYEANAFTEYLEKECNIDIEFNFLPSDGNEALSKLNLILSSGEKLTDVINMGLGLDTATLYGDSGVFMELTELYENCSVEFKKAIAEYPQYDIFSRATTYEGKLYGLPTVTKEEIGLAPQKAWINTRFLEALDMKMPTTTDELYDYLLAVKNNDPNGNGKTDEIPMVGANAWASEVIPWVMNAFIYYDNSSLYALKDGKVDVIYRQEEYRQGLTYLNKLCTEGLLSPLSFTQKADQLKQLVDSDGETPVAGLVTGFATSMILNNVKENPFTKDYVGLPPIKGPEEVAYTTYVQPSVTLRWFVTKDCRNPELAFRVGDFMWSEEAYCRARFGVEGQDFNYIDPQENKPANIKGFTALIDQPKSNWNEGQNSHWRAENPCFSYDYLDCRLFSGDVLNATYTAGLAAEEYNKYLPKEGEYVPALKFTSEETKSINEIQTNLKTYVGESAARFITGDLSLDKDWEKYVSELEKIGLEKFLEVSQTAYDRMK